LRTTPELPDALLRSLKIQAAQSGESLKALLRELIERAIAMPIAPAAEVGLDFLHLQP
jgi:plasmid stability protein